MAWHPVLNRMHTVSFGCPALPVLTTCAVAVDEDDGAVALASLPAPSSWERKSHVAIWGRKASTVVNAVGTVAPSWSLAASSLVVGRVAA